VFCKFEACFFFIIDYNIDKMNYWDEDSDQEICADGLSDF